MNKYCFNVDFESQIFSQKEMVAWRSAVEFLLWWLEDCVLFSSVDYPVEYLKYLETKLGYLPKISKQSEHAKFWWGEIKPAENKIKINSKAFSFKLAQQLNLQIPNSFLVQNQIEFLQIIQNTNVKWLAKSLDGMSGKGHARIQSDNNKKMNFPIILEEELERYRDLGTYFLSDQNKFIFYENFVDNFFQYRGTVIGRGEKNDLILNSEEESQFNHYKTQLEFIKSFIQKNDYNEGFSLDSFFYIKDGKSHLYPLAEINARKTMGLVAWLLKNKFKAPWLSLFLIPNSKLKLSWQEISRISNASTFILSPEMANLSWHCVLGESREIVLRLKKEWEEKLLCP